MFFWCSCSDVKNVHGAADVLPLQRSDSIIMSLMLFNVIKLYNSSSEFSDGKSFNLLSASTVSSSAPHPQVWRSDEMRCSGLSWYEFFLVWKQLWDVDNWYSVRQGICFSLLNDFTDAERKRIEVRWLWSDVVDKRNNGTFCEMKKGHFLKTLHSSHTAFAVIYSSVFEPRERWNLFYPNWSHILVTCIKNTSDFSHFKHTTC